MPCRICDLVILSHSIDVDVRLLHHFKNQKALLSRTRLKKSWVSPLSAADMMLFEKDERGPKEDEELLLQFEAVAKLDPREKEIIKEMIDGILLKHDARRWSQARG